MQTQGRAVEQVYDALSADFSGWSPSAGFLGIYDATVGRLLHGFACERPLGIAELGCGHGTWLKYTVDLLRARGCQCEALGIDVSAERLRRGQQYLSTYPEVTLKRANLLEHEPTGIFDLIYIFEVFSHFRIDEQRCILGRWLPRVAPGGALVVVDKDRRSRHALLIEAQKRLGRFDFMLGRLRRFPPRFRDLVATISYPDFRRLQRDLSNRPAISTELVRHREFTGLIVHRLDADR